MLDEAIKRSQYLSKRESWTPMMIYIHRSRITFGLICGLLIGLPVGLTVGLALH